MHIKCGAVFRCCYVLAEVVFGFGLGINTENFTPMCSIFVADDSKITRALIQQLKHSPGTLWKSLTATFPGEKFPILIEVSQREHKQQIGIGPAERIMFIQRS